MNAAVYLYFACKLTVETYRNKEKALYLSVNVLKYEKNCSGNIDVYDSVFGLSS